MTHPKILALLVALLCGSGVLRAQLVETYTFSSFDGAGSLTIPDGQAAGVSDPRTLASAITQISSVKVTLDITGDFNGDLYAIRGSPLGFTDSTQVSRVACMGLRRRPSIAFKGSGCR